MRRSSRIAKTKALCICRIKSSISNEEIEIKKRLQAIAIVIENVVYHDGDIEHPEATKYLNIVKEAKENLPRHSPVSSFCDLITNQLNKIIQVINSTSKSNETENTNTDGKGNNGNNENEGHSSGETYCAVLEDDGTDPVDTNELGSDVKVEENSISKKNIDVEDFIPLYKIVPQVPQRKKFADNTSHEPCKPSSDEILDKNHQPIDKSKSIANRRNRERSIPKASTSKITEPMKPPTKANIPIKPEINSCPVLPNPSKPTEITDQPHSEQNVFRKPLSYKPKLPKKRKQVVQKNQRVQISNEIMKTDISKLLANIDKAKINKTIQTKAPNRSVLLKNNAIRKTNTIYNVIKKPDQQQFTIRYNATPDNAQNAAEKVLATDETYNSEDCFDDMFTDNQATDTDESLMMLDLKYKRLNIRENTENTAIISEVEESTDWTIDSPIAEAKCEPQQVNEPSGSEEELQNKIEEIKSQENFKYNENESVVTNIRNYRKTFVKKILQLRDVMQGTPMKHPPRQNVNSLFKNRTKDGSSDEIGDCSQYVCPSSPQTERYKAVEMFVNRENETDEEFIKRLKDSSREISGMSVKELLQKMNNYKRL